MMRNNPGVPELTFKYSVAQLLEKLKANREAHIETHKAAMAGFKRELIDRLLAIGRYAEARAILLKKASQEDDLEVDQRKLSIHDLDTPKEYTKYYDEAIEMLEMTTANEIELPQSYFRQLVRDEWDWKSEFTAYSAKYVDSVR